MLWGRFITQQLNRHHISGAAIAEYPDATSFWDPVSDSSVLQPPHFLLTCSNNGDNRKQRQKSRHQKSTQRFMLSNTLVYSRSHV
jgi:hypothetical protein